MATEMHRVHICIQKLHFVHVSQDIKAIKVIFYNLVTLFITFIFKKRTKRKAVVGKIYILSFLVNISVSVFLCSARTLLSTFSGKSLFACYFT